MNKFKTIILAILGASDVIINIITPILLVFVWISLSGFKDWGSYILYGVGLLATIFRAIRIGWLK